MSAELPNQWSYESLSSVCSKIVDGSHNPPKGVDSGFPMLSARNIQRRQINFDDFRYISEKDFIIEHARTNIEAGDVLLTIVGTIGRTAVVRPELESFALQRSVAVLKPVIDSCFLSYSLEAPTIQKFLNDNAKGTAQKGIYLKALSQLVIPVAPIKEQKRIADKLDNLLGRVDTCREHLDRVPKILKRFRQSVLAAATSGELTKDWRDKKSLPEPNKKNLGDVIKVSSGNFLPSKNMALNGTIPVFGGNGVNGYHDQSNVVEETLVIGRVGYYCGCVHMTPRLAWVTDNALIVKHNESTTLKRFLYFALQAIDLRTNDSSTAQPVISGQKIYNLAIAIPCLREQHEIVRRIEPLFSFADQMEERYKTTLAKVERLTPSTLDKAFRGELVPQDPNDEPASTLLGGLAASKLTTIKQGRAKRSVPKGND